MKNLISGIFFLHSYYNINISVNSIILKIFNFLKPSFEKNREIITFISAEIEAIFLFIFFAVIKVIENIGLVGIIKENQFIVITYLTSRFLA